MTYSIENKDNFKQKSLLTFFKENCPFPEFQKLKNKKSGNWVQTCFTKSIKHFFISNKQLFFKQQ